MKTRRGMTLVETMIALVILGVGLLGVVQGTVAVSQQNAMARKRTVAQALARELADDLKEQAYTSAQLSCTVGGCAAPTPSVTTMTLAGTTATFNPDPGPHLETGLGTLGATRLAYLAGVSDSAGRPTSGTRYWRAWYVSEPEPGFKAIRVEVFFDDGTGGFGHVTHHAGAFNSALLSTATGGAALY